MAFSPLKAKFFRCPSSITHHDTNAESNIIHYAQWTLKMAVITVVGNNLLIHIFKSMCIYVWFIISFSINLPPIHTGEHSANNREQK